MDSKPKQVVNKKYMEKLQPKVDVQNPSESMLSFSMLRDDNVQSIELTEISICNQKHEFLQIVMDVPFEESEVIQETIRTYAKQIPKSPIKHNLKANISSLSEKSLRGSPISDQNVLKSVNNSSKKTSSKKDYFNQNEFMSPEQTKRQLNTNKNTKIFQDIDQNANQTKSITQTNENLNSKKETSRTIDEKDFCSNTIQNMSISSPRNDIFSNQILNTQQNEKSFSSQCSFYSYTLPYCSYDKENSHSGYISYSNIKPKKTLLSSIKKLSMQFFTNTKQMYNETFLNRKRCQCDLNLDEGETCSQAFKWLSTHYKSNNLVKMKEQYKSLLQMKDIYAKYKNQIDKDAVRTFPTSGLFAEGQQLSQQLKNVLYAFSVYDIQVGYVQGMNSIVGIMLYHAEEYLAFWLTCMIFESLEMRDIYLPELPGIKKHIYLIEFLMWKHIPYLHQIFSDNDIKVEVICQPWIISLCGILLPIEYMSQFIDILLQQGWSFFYRFVIAYILLHEEEILKQQDPGDVIVLLTSQAYQLERIQSDDQIQWDQILKSAQNIKVNEIVIRELFEKYDIETKDFRKE